MYRKNGKVQKSNKWDISENDSVLWVGTMYILWFGSIAFFFKQKLNTRAGIIFRDTDLVQVEACLNLVKGHLDDAVS